MTKPTITIVGLGPAGPDFIAENARTALADERPTFLRTREHPAAVLAPHAKSFDDIYEQAETIESVYRDIADALVAAAEAEGDLVYAVPGSPLIAEATVDHLRNDARVDVKILPALSFLDLVWNRLAIDPLAANPRIVDGRRFAVEAAGERGPLLVAQCDAQWVLSDIKLAYENETPESVVVLQRLGLEDENIVTIDWEDLDRVVEPDYLTSLWIPKVSTPVAFELARLDEVARRLRRECPWDQEQTHQTLARHLLEEAYELLEAIDNLDSEDDDADEHFLEELGDVLFQVFAHSAIAAEDGRFNIADVAAVVADKLIQRHPHVYGDVVAETSDEVKASWEANKKKEKGRASIMEGIPSNLPALLYAAKVIRKAKTAGVRPEHAEGAGHGDRLFALVDQVVTQDGDAEEELRWAASQFRSQFERFEQLATTQGRELQDLSDQERTQLWNQAAQQA